MIDFNVHPNVYTTGRFTGLRNMLEHVWIRNLNPGDGTIFIISGFSNFNGGARFYRNFTEHTENGGRIVAFLGGSTSQRLSSRQVVEALLGCGAEVNIINRKRLLHAKCYGNANDNGQNLIVTSGNFTGPGMSQNVEASVFLDEDTTRISNFSWHELEQKLIDQRWLSYNLNLEDLDAPGWQLLYDETPREIIIDESDQVSLVIVLGHSDTARILASPGTRAAKGTQYFWLSKDSYDFFPPLNIRNVRGYKGTLSALINMYYVDLDYLDTNCRVTFEAENNFDFRLGTGPLRYTHQAEPGDIACISRIREAYYELRIFRNGTQIYDDLSPYAINFIGHRGKRFGYIENSDFEEVVDINLGENIN